MQHMVSRYSLLKPHLYGAEVTYVFTYGTSLAITMVYLDVIGLPNASFYYTIAMLGAKKPWGAVLAPDALTV